MNEACSDAMLVRVSLTFFPYCYLETGFPCRLLSTHTYGRLKLAVQTVSMGRGVRDTGRGWGWGAGLWPQWPRRAEQHRRPWA